MPESLVGKTAERRTFHTLDGMRGVAALTVAMIHYEKILTPISVRSGYLAVDLFFIMSGFVLDHAYGQKLRRSGALDFLRMRFVRLYPLYLAGLLIAVTVPASGLLMGVSRSWTASRFLWAVIPGSVMLPAPPTDGRLPLLYPLDFPAWSLLFELLVNIVYAAVARHLSMARLASIAGVSGLLLAATCVIHGSLNGGWIWTDAWVGLVRVSFGFFVGVTLHRLHLSGRRPRFRPPPVLVLAATIALLVADPGHWRPTYDFACATIAFPLLVWSGASRDPVRGVKLFSVLGMISYPLYVIHLPCRNVMDRFFHHLMGGKLAAHAPVSGLVLLAALSLVSYVLATTYDVRARRALGRLMAPRGA